MTRLLILLALLLMCAGPAAADSAVPPAPASTGKPAASADDSAGLDQPAMDDTGLLTWAASAASDIMTFSNKDFQQRFIATSRHFTKGGWQGFSAQLKNSGRFDAVLKNNLSLSSQPGAAPVIREQGVVEGKYRWRVDFPLIVRSKGSDDVHEETLQVHLVIQRVPVSDSPNGIQISQWDAQ